MRTKIHTGLDRLLDDPVRLRALQSARVGLLVNPSSVTRHFEHAIDALATRGVTPARLFGPEHGVRGEAQDMIAVDDATDPISGIPVVSLYGDSFESLAPTAAHLDGLDVVVIDLQDVGSRYYTYVYTAFMTAKACLEAGVRVVVLDRPNPIVGTIEGPAVSPSFESFVGMLPLPNRHGLTLAEVLRFGLGATAESLDVVTVEGWSRSMWQDEHDAPWVLPSPNMPTLDTAIVYPGMCLLEGTNASEGRGTTRPFELFGAPYVDAPALRAKLGGLGLPGVRFRLVSFEPTFQKWARQRCSGLQIHVTDRDAYNSLLTGAAIVWAMHQLFADFAWRVDAYEFVDDIPAIDLLFGSAAPRLAIESGCDWETLKMQLRTPATLVEAVMKARLPVYD